MLVYAVRLSFLPGTTLPQLLTPAAAWAATKVRARVTASDLAGTGTRRFTDPLGCRLDVLAGDTQHGPGIAIELTHSDATVRGRQWSTSLGLRPEADGGVLASVVVCTNDISPLVTETVTPHPPRLIASLSRSGTLHPTTPGRRLRALTTANMADVYHYDVLDPARRAPLVIISPLADGSYHADPGVMRDMLIGLADVLVIPPDADTRAISRQFTAIPAPYRGAVTIVMPKLRAGTSMRWPSIVLTPDDLQATPHGAPALNVLARVVHRTNLPLSRDHLSREALRDLIRGVELQRARQALHESPQLSDYEQLLNEAAEENHALRLDRAALADDRDREYERAEDLDDQLRLLRYQFETLKASKAQSGGRQPAATQPADATIPALVGAVIGRKPPIATVLQLIEALYPDRVLVLPSARKSAARHDTFRFGDQAFDLLQRLLTTYADALAAGKPDAEARQIFGQHEFAAKEANLSNTGRRARTFSVEGYGTLFMEPHLKIQRGDNRAESFRCHFEWLADRGQIVIGHCGEHLPP